jgi:hypothetical protein
MKKLIFPLLLLLTVVGCVPVPAQKMSEKQAIEKSHIDFTKQYLFFTIHGLIEIDGHIFKNDTCKCPIIFQATIDDITIIDTCTKTKYTHRVCKIKGCPIIHLEVESGYTAPAIQPSWRYFHQPTEQNLRLLNNQIDTL